MTAAFVYLTLCSIRNGVRLRLRRLRQARYLLIGLGLVLYFGSMLWNRPASGILSISPAYRQLAEARGGRDCSGPARTGLGAAELPRAAVHVGRGAVPLSGAGHPTAVDRLQAVAAAARCGRYERCSSRCSWRHRGRCLQPASRAAPSSSLAVMALYQTGVSLYRKSAEERVRLQGAGASRCWRRR